MEQNKYTEQEFREFVNKFDWVFAKTYAETAPHEYIVLKKVGKEYKNDFVKVANFIRENDYYSRIGFYYRMDENYYWTMDVDVNDTDLINRAKRDDYELINNMWKWKGQKK